MKLVLFVSGLLLLSTLVAIDAPGEEANASVYVVDRSDEFAEMGGACLVYTPAQETGKDREIICLAKGPPGSTLLMIAFDRDASHLDLAPAIAAQTEDSDPLRFPSEGTAWPYVGESSPVDLYVVAFSNDDPQLPWFIEYAGHLEEALAGGDRDTALLHALATKYRLSSLLRQRSAADYRVAYGEPEGESGRSAPPSIAGVTRGTSPKGGRDPLLDAAGREPKSSIAAVRRGLNSLDKEWREDSHAIPFGPGSPGILIFPVSSSTAP